MKTIGVGVIGADSIDPGSEALAHVTVIHASPDFALRAVTSSLVASDAAGADGVVVYHNPRDLIGSSRSKVHAGQRPWSSHSKFLARSAVGRRTVRCIWCERDS